jgi:hypothetical protein
VIERPKLVQGNKLWVRGRLRPHLGGRNLGFLIGKDRDIQMKKVYVIAASLTLCMIGGIAGAKNLDGAVDNAVAIGFAQTNSAAQSVVIAQSIEGQYSSTIAVSLVAGGDHNITGGSGHNITGGSGHNITGGSGHNITGGSGHNITGGSGHNITGGSGHNITGGSGH